MDDSVSEQLGATSVSRKFSDEAEVTHGSSGMDSSSGSHKSTSVGQLFAAFCHEHCTSTRAAQDIIDAICSNVVALSKPPSATHHLIMQLCEHCLRSAALAAGTRADGERTSSLDALPDHANILFFGGALQAMHRSRLAKHAIEELIGVE